jgi:hypothetical protein
VHWDVIVLLVMHCLAVAIVIAKSATRRFPTPAAFAALPPPDLSLTRHLHQLLSISVGG